MHATLMLCTTSFIENIYCKRNLLSLCEFIILLVIQDRSNGTENNFLICPSTPQPVHLKGNQTWVFIGRTDAEAEAPITDSLEKTLMLGKIEGGRRRERQRMRGWMASLTQWTWVWESPGVGDGQGGLACCSPWGLQRAGHDWVTEQHHHHFSKVNTV